MNKKLFLTKVASVIMVFATFGASTRSFILGYQPEIPEKLRKH